MSHVFPVVVASRPAARSCAICDKSVEGGWSRRRGLGSLAGKTPPAATAALRRREGRQCVRRRLRSDSTWKYIRISADLRLDRKRNAPTGRCGLWTDYRRTQIWPINQLNDERSDLLRLSVEPPASNAPAAAAGLLPLHWGPIRCPRADGGLAVVTKVSFSSRSRAAVKHRCLHY
jgi:hypothetical protein